jgi:hypothetical protein
MLFVTAKVVFNLSACFAPDSVELQVLNNFTAKYVISTNFSSRRGGVPRLAGGRWFFNAVIWYYTFQQPPPQRDKPPGLL